MHNLSFFPFLFLAKSDFNRSHWNRDSISLSFISLIFESRLGRRAYYSLEAFRKVSEKDLFFRFFRILKGEKDLLFIYLFIYFLISLKGRKNREGFVPFFFFNREMIYTETFHSRFLFLYSLQKTRVKFERSFFERIERISRKSFRKGKRFDSLRNIVFLYRCVGCVEAGFNEDVGGRRESVELSLS